VTVEEDKDTRADANQEHTKHDPWNGSILPDFLIEVNENFITTTTPVVRPRLFGPQYRPLRLYTGGYQDTSQEGRRMKTITFPDCFADLDAVSRAVFLAMAHADQAELTFEQIKAAAEIGRDALRQALHALQQQALIQVRRVGAQHQKRYAAVVFSPVENSSGASTTTLHNHTRNAVVENQASDEKQAAPPDEDPALVEIPAGQQPWFDKLQADFFLSPDAALELLRRRMTDFNEPAPNAKLLYCHCAYALKKEAYAFYNYVKANFLNPLFNYLDRAMQSVQQQLEFHFMQSDELSPDLTPRAVSETAPLILKKEGEKTGMSPSLVLPLSSQDEGDCFGNSAGGELPAAVWNAVLAALKPRINPPSFNTWLRPLTATFEAAACVIKCPDDTFVYWLRAHYGRILHETIRAVTGQSLAIRYVVAEVAS